MYSKHNKCACCDNILTKDGITFCNCTLGLNGWEIVEGSKVLRPKAQFTSTNKGILGDPQHLIDSINLNRLVLYNGTNTHTIITAAAVPYTWITPISLPSNPSVITCNTNGLINYASSSGPNQMIVTDNLGNISWINQCSFGNLNTNIITPTFFNSNYSNKKSGVVVRLDNSPMCFWNVQPDFNGTGTLNKSNQVLVTNANGDILWIDQSSLGVVSAVNSLTSEDGIITTSSSGDYTLSLDGWQIDPISKSFKPKISLNGSIG